MPQAYARILALSACLQTAYFKLSYAKDKKLSYTILCRRKHQEVLMFIFIFPPASCYQLIFWVELTNSSFDIFTTTVQSMVAPASKQGELKLVCCSRTTHKTNLKIAIVTHLNITFHLNSNISLKASVPQSSEAHAASQSGPNHSQ